MVFSIVLPGRGEGDMFSVLQDIRNAYVSLELVVRFNLEHPGNCSADHVSSWHWLLEILEPNLWPTPSKWIKVYGMFILY